VTVLTPSQSKEIEHEAILLAPHQFSLYTPLSLPTTLSYALVGNFSPKEALILALQSPSIQFTVVDKDIKSLHALQEDAKTFLINNIKIATALEDSYDVIALHKGYSKVKTEAKAQLLESAKKHLKENGLLYISFHCLAYWARNLVFREILSELFVPRRPNTEVAIKDTYTFFEDLEKEKAAFLNTSPFFMSFMKDLQGHSVETIEKEFLCEEWQAYCHIEVRRPLEQLGFHYQGSLHKEQFAFMNHTRAEFDKNFPDTKRPHLFDEFKDFYLDTELRQELYSLHPLQNQRNTALVALSHYPDADESLHSFEMKNHKVDIDENQVIPLLLQVAGAPKAYEDLASDTVDALLSKGLIDAVPSHTEFNVDGIKKWNTHQRKHSLLPLISPVTGARMTLSKNQDLYFKGETESIPTPSKERCANEVYPIFKSLGIEL
jgi:SAM-dependent methyltransferase